MPILDISKISPHASVLVLVFSIIPIYYKKMLPYCHASSNALLGQEIIIPYSDFMV